MGIIESEFGDIFSPPVKRKRNTTKPFPLISTRDNAKRITQGGKEVLIKITGFGKGSNHVKAHLNYITKHGKIELENESGEIIKGKENLNNLFSDWKSDLNNSERKKNQRDTMHMVLSMPKEIDSKDVKNAVREFAKKNFGENHTYAFALHTHQNNPHCHLVVHCRGFDGKRLNPRKADLQHWREEFAEALKHQGVNATATPRRSRGVIKKEPKSAVWHTEHGDKTHKPKASKTKVYKYKEAVENIKNESENGTQSKSRPWEKPILEKQGQIRKAWLNLADTLETTKTIKTFKGKEAINERPNYERIRNGNGSTFVHKSHFDKPGPRTPPGTVTSLRNLSCSDMVHDQRPFEMFLQSNALDSVGRKRTTDNEMRWTRDSNNGNSSRNKSLTLAEENKILAGSIRDFVKNMPKIETERHQIESELRRKFTEHNVRQTSVESSRTQVRQDDLER